MSRSWSVVDFILIWLAGQFGAAIGVSVGTATGAASLLLASLVGQYVFALGLLYLLVRRKEEDRLEFTIEGGDFAFIGVGLVLQLGIAFMLDPISRLLFPDGRPEQSVASSLAEADSTSIQITLFVAYVVVGPIAEELVYRGVLLRALESSGRWTAILVSSLVFAAIHLPGLETDQLLRSAALFLPPFFLLGVLLAWLTFRRGRLGPAIFVHSGWNLLAAIALLVPTEMLDQIS